MGQAVVAIFAVIAGIAIGVFIGKLMAQSSAQAQYDKRIQDAERHAVSAEAALPDLFHQPQMTPPGRRMRLDDRSGH